MKKILKLFICIFSMLSLLTVVGCSHNKNENTKRTVVDMQGNTISLPGKVTKYSTVYSSSVPMIAMLDKDLEKCVMYPKSSWFEYWEFEMFEGVEEHSVRVNKREVTAEQIVESGTEVFFWNKASHKELVDSLTDMGIACVNVQVQNTDDLIKALEIIAEVLDTDYARSQLEKYKEKFTKYQQYAKAQVEKIPEDCKRSILVIGNVDTLVGYGPNTYAIDWAEKVGLKYILPSKDGADEVNLTIEQVYEFDPDIILANGIFDVEKIYEDPVWSVLRATQNNMLLSNPSVLDFWSMPTPEAPLQYIWSINKFYPDYVGDLNIIDEVQSFYKEFYGYEMSREDAEAIVSGQHFLMDK